MPITITPIDPPGSSVSYKNPDFIEVYWGEWLYSFRLHLGVWNVDLRSVPLPCANRPPFLSLPF